MTRKSNISKKALKHLKKNWIKYGFETFVVILGILIAFALSNWNDNRLQRNLELNYLKRFIKDLKADSTYYDIRITNLKNEIIRNREAISEMYQTQNSIKEVNELFKKIAFGTEQLTVQNVSYIEMINAGKVDIIRNQELKERIVLYYKKSEEASKHTTEYNEVTTRFLINMGTSIKAMKLSYINNDIYEGTNFVTNEDWSFLNNPTSEKFKILENTVAIYKIRNQEFVDEFNMLKDMATQVIEDIQKELDNRN